MQTHSLLERCKGQTRSLQAAPSEKKPIRLQRTPTIRFGLKLGRRDQKSHHVKSSKTQTLMMTATDVILDTKMSECYKHDVEYDGSVDDKPSNQPSF